jgi:glycosyltransferase involved in cell wall biosynthesis
MRLVLAVADNSLGGTSRSALLFAALWTRAGAEVLIYSPWPLHQRRAELAAAHGVRVTTSLEEVRLFGAALTHLHHPAPSKSTLTWVRELRRALPGDVVVLTHNVFGQPLPVDLGQRVVVGVLGDWVSLQYRLQSPRRTHPIRIMPNPQDFEFFRPPTPIERQQARAELGIAPSDRVVLRVGSPTDEKWSRRGYSSLANTVERTSKVVARFIGAPLSYDFAGPRVTIVHEPVADAALRREYWAADVFAHWADRGESFGNVILEALGTGLPVVYRAVLTRDNTPAEFRDIPGFIYVKKDAEWQRRVVSAFDAQPSEFNPRLSRYSAAVVCAQLQRVVEASQGTRSPAMITEALLNALPVARRPRVHDVVAAGLRHNLLTAALKRTRLSGVRSARTWTDGPGK